MVEALWYLPVGVCTNEKNVKPKPEYKKFIYWLTKAEEGRLRQELEQRRIKLPSAKAIVCTPLDEINRISSVAPDVWSATCARQGSWYRASDKKGLYLIVSSFELENYREWWAATISRSDFIPPRYATQAEKQALLSNDAFLSEIPPGWSRADDLEKRIYLRWAKRLGSDETNYDSLHLSHTANHANFLRPQFLVERNRQLVPYSIDRSAHLCSCCLELFQVIGEQYPEKLVAPCPGATIFARLKPDQYLLVENAPRA
jgi:hypothetical protein